LFGFVTKHTCDGQTDRQNYDSQDHAIIAALCGNNNNNDDDLIYKAPVCRGTSVAGTKTYAELSLQLRQVLVIVMTAQTRSFHCELTCKGASQETAQHFGT